jgi:hypothetical protein
MKKENINIEVDDLFARYNISSNPSFEFRDKIKSLIYQTLEEQRMSILIETKQARENVIKCLVNQNTDEDLCAEVDDLLASITKEIK